MIKKIPTLYVIIFAIIFSAKFYFLANGSILNSYPFVSPDGFDWYLEGVQLFYPFYESPVSLPVLRPPIFVIITGLDVLIGDNIFISVIAGLNIIIFYIFCIKILMLFIPKLSLVTKIFVAISATISPINFVRIYLLADPLAVSLYLCSIYYLLVYIKHDKNKIFLFAGLGFSLVGGLTQTYALIPFITILIYYSLRNSEYINFKYIIYLMVFFFAITFFWRYLIPHLNTPDNFNLISFNNNNFIFYLNNWLYYLSPLFLSILYCGLMNINYKTINLDGIIIVFLAFSLLIYIYQWQESRFTFYLWPLLILICASLINAFNLSFHFLICYILVIFLSPLNYWNVKLGEIRFDFSKTWIITFFDAKPVIRGINDCNVDCLSNLQFYIESDSYMKSLLKLNAALK